MGQTPSKFFPMPTPYGNSPDMGVLAQAKAASPAPLNNFLPLNPQDPSQQQQPQQPSAGGFPNQLGNQMPFQRPNIFNYGYGGEAQRARNLS